MFSSEHNSIIFKQTNELGMQRAYKTAQVKSLQNELTALGPRYIRQLVEDAQALKGRWFETVDEGHPRIFHCLGVSLRKIIPFDSDSDSNIFLDRVNLTYDATGGIIDGEYIWQDFDKPLTNIFQADVIRGATPINYTVAEEKYHYKGNVI